MNTATPTERPTHNPNASKLKQLEYDTLGNMAVRYFTMADRMSLVSRPLHVPVERAGVKP